MTGVRAWIRRGLVSDAQCVRLPEENERAWTALYIHFQVSVAELGGKGALAWTEADVLSYVPCLELSGRFIRAAAFPFLNSFFPHFEVITGAYTSCEISARLTLAVSFPAAVAGCKESPKLWTTQPLEIQYFNMLVDIDGLHRKDPDIASQLNDAALALTSFLWQHADVEWANGAPPSLISWQVPMTVGTTKSTTVRTGWERHVEFEVLMFHLTACAGKTYELKSSWGRKGAFKSTIVAILTLSSFSINARKEFDGGE